MTHAASAPLFSIITVVRNDRPGLALTRDSVAGQSLRDLEWIAIDGASTDGSREFLEARAHELAAWRSAPDHGPFDAMNRGLAMARGGYLLFLNAGDRFATPDTLAGIAQALRDSADADFVYGDALEETADGRRLYKPARSHRHAWYGMFTHHQAMAYRRACVGDLVYSPRYRIGADYAYTLAALARARSIVRLKEPLCVFAHGGLSQRHAAEGRRDSARIRRDFLGWGLPRRAAITAAQWAAVSIRQAFPSLYERARCHAALPPIARPASSDGNFDDGFKISHSEMVDKKLHTIPLIS
ncbi:MAG TPA: glycosyltransferase family 2 protein [Azospirillaceae bacterium]|nr:glycosyltransferase family 2 protein [Azospirillaceae bacterium]